MNPPTAERDINSALARLNETSARLAKATQELVLKLQRVVKPVVATNSTATDPTPKHKIMCPLAEDILKAELCLRGTLGTIEYLKEDVEL